MARLISNYPYVAAVVLFGIGIYTILCDPNLVKKIIGANIMSSAAFLLFVAAGNVRGGIAPIVTGKPGVYVNPIPAALILTGIVVSLSVTAFALALVVRIFNAYRTIDADFLSVSKEEVKA